MCSELSYKQFFEITKSENLKFCFIIGAGASKESGIATGAELAKRWYGEIQANTEIKNIFDALISEKNINITEDNLKEHYSLIYKLRFRYMPIKGYQELYNEMKDKKPSKGYTILSNIAKQTANNIIITTNFDTLIENAFIYYTAKSPLVISHESLCDYFLTYDNVIPIIAKIHNSIFFDPKSDPDKVEELSIKWTKHLDRIFEKYTPLFIGYGGNDGSLMNYLEKRDFNYNKIYWCNYYRNEPIQRVKDLIKKSDGFLISIKGFDDFMSHFNDNVYRIDIKENIKKIEEEVYHRIISSFTSTTEVIELLRNLRDTDIKKKFLLKAKEDFPDNQEIADLVTQFTAN